MTERILVLAAHPDDETIGAGASIARWSEQGDEVFVWFATDGVSSREHPPEPGAARRAAALRALEILGVTKTFFADFPDNALDSVGRLPICRAMAAVAESLRPSLVLTHSQADLNVDHRLVGECGAVISRPKPGHFVNSVWHFEVPSSTGWFGDSTVCFTPTHFVDVGGYLHRKIAALEEYGIEIPGAPHARSSDALQALARSRGSSAGIEVAEAFSVSFDRR